MMLHQKATTEEEAQAKKWVIWDIKTCPVPADCDASQVGLCIKRALKHLGYNGDVTITAIGILTDVPDNLLQSVSSTGIVLCHTPTDAVSIASAMFFSTDENPPPANVLLMSARYFFYPLEFLRTKRYNVLPQVFYDYKRDASATPTQIDSLWIKFFKRFLKEEKCSETSECEWVCRACDLSERKDCECFTVGQGFEDFTNHLLSEEHHQKMLNFLSPDLHESYEKKAKAFRDSHPKNADSHLKIGDSHPKDADSHPKIGDSHHKNADSHPKIGDSHPKDADSHPKNAITRVNNEPNKCKKQRRR